MPDATVKWFGKDIMVLATKANVTAMKIAALDLERAVKKSFGTGASRAGRGVLSRRSGRGKTAKFHRPSAPGFVPAVDTGVLKSSVNSDINMKGQNILGRVGSDLDKMKQGLISQGKSTNTQSSLQYGFFLEVGTDRGLEARPWLRPALEKMSGHILSLFKKANS